MTSSPPSRRRSPSPFWALLILPTFAAIGWIVGAVPVRRPPSSAPEGPGAATARPAPERAAAPGDPVPDLAARPVENPAPAPPRPEISQWTSLDAAIAESGRNGKPVLIDFSADWCGPCRRMKRGVFDDWTRGQAVQAAVIPVSIVDRVREEGRNPPEVESLQRRYGIEAFPTLVVFSPATGRTLSARGYGGDDQTVTWIRQAAREVSGP